MDESTPKSCLGMVIVSGFAGGLSEAAAFVLIVAVIREKKIRKPAGQTLIGGRNA